MVNRAETLSGHICWPPRSFTGDQRADQLAARGQKLMAIDGCRAEHDALVVPWFT